MHVPLLVLGALLCLLMPAALAVWAHRRLGAAYGLWGFGALTFVLSQVVHIPLNLAVGRAFTSGLLPTPPETWSVWLLPLGLGLSAGMCEEPARWLAYRRLPDARSWGQGLMLGAGHGGIEAMLVGMSIGTSALVLGLAQQQGAAALGLPPEMVPVIEAQLNTALQTPAWQMLLGALERALSLICHITMSLLVLQSVRAGRLGGLVASVAFHTLVNAGAVWFALRSQPLWAELWIAGFAAVGLMIIMVLRREDAPAPVEAPPVALRQVERVPIGRSAAQREEER